jgi:Ca-activated chloride channel family protein
MDARDSLALLLDGPQGRMILPPTSAADRSALDRGVAALKAEGAPRGLEGLRRAYALAAQRRAPGAVQRVVWILDGEFSAEAGTREALASLIREQTEWGVLLKVLGFWVDEDIPESAAAVPSLSRMPFPGTTAYASVASQAETLSALRRESLSRPDPVGGDMVADDVQVEVRFNPERVDRWRLLGQETRVDTQPQSGGPDGPNGGGGSRIDAGHSVTALYEVIPARAPDRGGPTSSTGPLSAAASEGVATGTADLLSLEVGYRSPEKGQPARTLRVGVPDVIRGVDAATADYKFAAAVVGYGLLLRDSPFKEDLTWDKVLTLAEEGQGPDREGYRAEFLQLVRRAAALNASEGGSPPTTPAKSPAATAPTFAPLRPPPAVRPEPRPQPERP